MKRRASALGSSSSTDPAAPVGRLGKPNGLEGFIGLYAEPEDLVHFTPGSVVLVGGEPLTVRALRQGKKGPQVAFQTVRDRAAAEAIRGSDVRVAGRRGLGEDEYWPQDLIGLAVRPGGGTVVAIEHGPAQDRLVVERSGTRFEVPFVAALVPMVDLEGGFVEVVEMEGLS